VSPELLIIAALAIYRLTLMFNSERGPKDIFGRLRTRLGIKFDEFSQSYSDGWIGQAILCFYCLSIWVSFAITGLFLIGIYFNRLGLIQWGLLPFALSGAAILLRNHDPSNSNHQ